MKLNKLLAEFYKKNGIPSDGGINKNTFGIKVLGINLKLPNPNFRSQIIFLFPLILIIASIIFLKK